MTPPNVSSAICASVTYIYHSGTDWDLQTEMGLTGALIVRPSGHVPGPGPNRRAYAHADSAYDREFLYFLTDMDENIHDQVEHQMANNLPIKVDMTKWYPQYWYMNGRSGTDTVLPAGATYLPTQPYNALTLGELDLGGSSSIPARSLVTTAVCQPVRAVALCSPDREPMSATTMPGHQPR